MPDIQGLRTQSLGMLPGYLRSLPTDLSSQLQIHEMAY